MARSSRSSRSRIVSTRRQTGWEQGPGGFTLFSSAGPTAGILGPSTLLVVDGHTLVRTRGVYELVLKTAATVGDGFHGALGIGVVTEPAFSVGVTAIPTPISEVEWDGWLWHEFFSLTSPTVTPGENSASVIRMPIDSKAMRKVGINEVIYAAIEMTEIGVATLDARLNTRILFKLP